MLSCKSVYIVIVALINPKISSCWKQCVLKTKGINNLKITGNNIAERLRLYSNKNINDEYNTYYSEESYREGEELARELYELVRIREFKEKLKENESQMQIGLEDRTTSTTSSSTDERRKREQNSSAFSSRREIINGNDNTLSAGLFTQSGKSAYFTTSSENNRQDSIYSTSSNAKRQILEQEFNLVNIATNERTILIQAAVCMVLLVFYLYIGFMGGITSGSFNMEDMMDFELDYEQVESNTQYLWI